MTSHNTNALRQVVSKNVRARRKALGLSQELLAEATNLTQVHISHIETGAKSATLDTVEKIAKALNVSAYELLVP